MRARSCLDKIIPLNFDCNDEIYSTNSRGTKDPTASVSRQFLTAFLEIWITVAGEPPAPFHQRNSTRPHWPPKFPLNRPHHIKPTLKDPLPPLRIITQGMAAIFSLASTIRSTTSQQKETNL